MSTYTLTVKLPPHIYRRAAEVAKATQRSIEQVVVDWIQPKNERHEEEID